MCSETLRWFPIESCRVKLTPKRVYARFCDDLKVEDDDGQVDDGSVQLFHQREAIDLLSARTKYSLKRRSLETIREYANLVGKRCVSDLLYYLS